MTTFTVNAMGLVMEIEDPLANAVTFDYDAFGNRTEVIDQKFSHGRSPTRLWRG